MAATVQVPQHVDALARANRARLERAAARRRIAALGSREGALALAELVLDPPAGCESARLADVLEWPERWGTTRARRLCRSVSDALERGRPSWRLEAAQLGELTMRERVKVAEGLGRVVGREVTGALS